MDSSWLDALAPHAKRLATQSLATLLGRDPARLRRDALRWGPLYLNLARQRLDGEAWSDLLGIARKLRLRERLAAQIEGEVVNLSEARAALHTALRSDLGRSPRAREARAQARATLARAEALAARLRSQGITDVLHVGIGGSELGPRLVLEALGAARGPCVHFLSAPDGHRLQALLARLAPERTAAVIVSKSFGTAETLLNARAVRDWLGGKGPMVAVTARPDAARGFGIEEDAILPMWDWVGGRFSLWSAVGFSVLLALGAETFAELLAGAAGMDRHAVEAVEEGNLPLRHALSWIWNRNALGLASLAVLPYDHRLASLPAHLQQLVMESLGKAVLADGSAAVAMATAPILWGGSGNDGQHSFMQALHQGTDAVPVEFVAVARPDHARQGMHRMLLASLLGQSEALAKGAEHEDPRRAHPGNRPSSVLLLDRLDGRSLGALLAMYEHSVVFQAMLWGINPFDQWGVELGKSMARDLLAALEDPGRTVPDPVSAELVRVLRAALES